MRSVIFLFGGLIDCPPNHMWIAEGIVSYLTQLVFEQMQDISVIERYAEWVAQIPSIEHAPLAELPMDHPQQFMLVRSKAALVLHLLRQELGDAPFMLLLRTLVDRLQNTTADTGVIMHICQELFPANHLEDFFTTHFYGVQEYTYDTRERTLTVKTG